MSACRIGGMLAGVIADAEHPEPDGTYRTTASFGRP
jgi:hypothetical protein